jgi:hypothetical protein
MIQVPSRPGPASGHCTVTVCTGCQPECGLPPPSPTAGCEVCTARNHRGRLLVTVSGVAPAAACACSADTRRMRHFIRCCAQQWTGHAQRDRKGSAINCMPGERETRADSRDPNLTKNATAVAFSVKFGPQTPAHSQQNEFFSLVQYL